MTPENLRKLAQSIIRWYDLHFYYVNIKISLHNHFFPGFLVFLISACFSATIAGFLTA